MIKFINVHMELSERFGLSFQENAYLTAIAGLQSLECYGFWAVMANADYCQALTISERTLQAMSKDLEKRGFLIRGTGTQKRACKEFCEAYILAKTGGAEIAGGAKTAPLGVQKLRAEGAKTAPNNKEYKETNTTLYTKREEIFLPDYVKASREAIQPSTDLKALPLPAHLPNIRPLYCKWLDDQAERGKRVTRAQAELALTNLGQICPTEAEAIKAIEKSINKGYSKFYNDGTEASAKPESMARGIYKQERDPRGGHRVENPRNNIFD